MDIEMDFEETAKSLVDYDFANRVIWLTGKFEENKDIAKIVSAIEYLSEESDEDITFKIAHDGGSTEIMWAVIDAMNRSRCDFITEVHGAAYSAAALVFLNGTDGKRFMSPHSFIFVHAQINSLSECDIYRNKSNFKRFDKDYDLYCKFIAEKLNKNEEDVKSWLKDDHYIWAKEGVEMGICKEL